jgi:phosphoribosyl 1,2-cyclic phosphodiesterase
MKVRLWGTRGSIPTPLRADGVEKKVFQALERYRDAGSPEDVAAFCTSLPLSVRGTYGGDTCCVEIDDGGDEIIVFDAGSGIRALGNAIMATGRGAQTIHIFVSHLHWDHIQGFPFFVPAYVPGNKILFRGFHEGFEQNVRQQQNWQNFPVSVDEMRADLSFEEFSPDATFTIGSCEISVFPHVHPGDSYGFVIGSEGKKVVYASDCDYVDMAPENFAAFQGYFADADLLIFDAQYTLEEIVSTKYRWGHSSFSIGIDLSKMAGVKRICFYHHDPGSNDDKLDEYRERALEYWKLTFADNPNCEVIWGYDGMLLEI